MANLALARRVPWDVGRAAPIGGVDERRAENQNPGMQSAPFGAQDGGGLLERRAAFERRRGTSGEGWSFSPEAFSREEGAGRRAAAPRPRAASKLRADARAVP